MRSPWAAAGSRHEGHPELMPDGRSIVIHGHFYQPPREDPWLGEVETEPTAAPFHDWNQRINHECYRAVVAARLPGAEGRIGRIVNTLDFISYDLGPTLATWMEHEAPETYAAFLESDRVSRARLGHGNAVATPYHHVILPLCTRRDKVTEVRWGMRDFTRRFGREPDGMWLPEAAVDLETLDVLAEEGIRFTIVGPEQVEQIPAGGLPGLHRTSGGKSIALFVYDGPLAHDVAFGPLIRDASLWSERLLGDYGEPRHLMSLATDGETFGHHHRFGEMALAAMLEQVRCRPEVTVENYSSFLSRHEPEEAVTVISPSSWSCMHGVERWRADCGCKTAPHVATQQAWRAPLREGLNWLAGELHTLYEREAGPELGDPWAARDATGGDRRARSTAKLPLRARELLELERNALGMFTSCGWFFDDVGGGETVLVLRHAARAVELAGESGARLEQGLLQRLAEARSNDPTVGDGANLYHTRVKPRFRAPERAGAGHAAARLVAPKAKVQIPGYEMEDGEEGIQVTDRRTGRSCDVKVTVTRPALGRIELAVESPPARRPAGPPARRPPLLTLPRLPARDQHVVRRELGRAVVENRFSRRELNSLASGARDLPGLAELALADAVGALADGASSDAIERVSDLIDLVDLLGLTISFEAQTRFYRARASLPEGDAARLAPLASRLGFVAA